MTIYEYNNITNSPDLNYIQNSVLESEMTNKTIEHCRWDENNSILVVAFTNSLSGEDKTILDTIVSNCPDISESVPTEVRLKSPNGTSWILTVDNNGVLGTAEVN